MDMDYTSWFAAIQANIDVCRISRPFLSRISRKARISRASTKTTTSVPAKSSLRTPAVYASLLLSTAAERPQNAPRRRGGRSAREAEASPAERREGGQLADAGRLPSNESKLSPAVARHLGRHVEHGRVRPSLQPRGVGAQFVRSDRCGGRRMHESLAFLALNYRASRAGNARLRRDRQRLPLRAREGRQYAQGGRFPRVYRGDRSPGFPVSL